MHKTYRYSNIRKAKSHHAEFLNPTSSDWFSELLDWLADRTLLVFGVVLVCLLLLSIACDQVLGSANASVPGSSAAITQGDSASTDKESSDFNGQGERETAARESCLFCRHQSQVAHGAIG